VPTRRFTSEPGFDKFNRTQYGIGYAFEHRFDETWSVRQNLRYAHAHYDWQQLYGTGMQADLRTLNRFAFRSDVAVDSFQVDTHAEARFATGPLRHTLLVAASYPAGRPRLGAQPLRPAHRRRHRAAPRPLRAGLWRRAAARLLAQHQRAAGHGPGRALPAGPDPPGRALGADRGRAAGLVDERHRQPPRRHEHEPGRQRLHLARRPGLSHRQRPRPLRQATRAPSSRSSSPTPSAGRSGRARASSTRSASSTSRPASTASSRPRCSRSPRPTCPPSIPPTR
jgi:hypothetical protein